MFIDNETENTCLHGFTMRLVLLVTLVQRNHLLSHHAQHDPVQWSTRLLLHLLDLPLPGNTGGHHSF